MNYIEGTQSTSSLHAAAQRISQSKKHEILAMRNVKTTGASSAKLETPMIMDVRRTKFDRQNLIKVQRQNTSLNSHEETIRAGLEHVR